MQSTTWQTKRNLLHLFFTCILGATLSACDDKPAEPPKKQTKKEVSNSGLTLTPGGVGPINATTAFNMHQMTLALGDYSVVEEVNYENGSALPAIRISKGVTTVMNVIPDATRTGIYSVIVEDNIVKNSLGHPLGTLYNAIYTYGQTQPCQLGSGELAGRMLCYAPKYPNILYVFNGNRGNLPVTTAPTADVLQGWALESIIWRPS